MESEHPFRVPSEPSSPLRQLSAEQMNQPRIPQSPSLHSYLAENDKSHHRSRESVSSDVQSKVALFSGLSSSPTRQGRGLANTSNAAFQRAVLGYEESQASLATARADIQRLQQQVESGQRRERMVSERIESLMEQLSAARESRESDKKAYITEIKKSRRQGYQAEMAMMEAREELKDTRLELRKAQAEVDKEKKKKEEARQEAFERAYTVSGLTEELELLKQKMKATAKERDAATAELRANTLHQHEAMLMMEKSVQTDAPAPELYQPKPKEDADATPRPSKPSKAQKGDHYCSKAPSSVKMPFYSDFVCYRATERRMDGEALTLEDHVTALYDELRYTRKEVANHLTTIHLMNMECQFQACACRHAEQHGTRFVYDVDWDLKMQEQQAANLRKIAEDKRFDQLPPDPSQEVLINTTEEPIMEEAVQIPLPSPKARELDSKGSTPEPTALLEEMTQVIVEPMKENEQFRFSTRSESHHRRTPPPLRHAHSAMEASEPDLFNLSPPKHVSARPATALGVSSLASPIRLVPDSAQPGISEFRSSTPQNEHPTTSRTMRVALKASSPGRSHRRAQSRPNIREHSHTRSPLATVKSNPDFTKSTSASPAASTVFPVTPISKHARPQIHHNISQTVTTITTVPLRGLDHEQGFNQFSHTPTTYSLTQPINMAMQSSDQSSEQLTNVPGTPLTREAALAQIRARRDRARSVNLKKEVGGGIKSAPGSARRGIALREALDRGREGRDISAASMASAPGRI